MATMAAGLITDAYQAEALLQEGDVDLLLEVAGNIEGRSFCALGDASAQPIKSGIKYFREEFEQGYHTPAWELFPYEANALYTEVAR